MDLSPGAVIAGRYRIDTRVGAGGMGEVWAAEDRMVGARVAVKTLLPAVAMNHEVIARFKREAYLLGKIQSHHITRVVDFVADDVFGLVLVMEFIEGDPLSRVLHERALGLAEAIDLAVGLATALSDLHRASIIHRDLKPGNIIMQPLPDGRRRAVVVDFGVSRLMADADQEEDEELTGITRADMAIGTIEYMAPEQILNSRNVTPASDIYAAGAILFRAIAGRHVYGHVASDAELAQKKLTIEAPPLPLPQTDKLGEGLARIIARMIRRRPSERYRSADEVLADLLPLRGQALASSLEADTTTVDAAVPMGPQAAPNPARAEPVPAKKPLSGTISMSAAPDLTRLSRSAYAANVGVAMGPQAAPNPAPPPQAHYAPAYTPRPQAPSTAPRSDPPQAMMAPHAAPNPAHAHPSWPAPPHTLPPETSGPVTAPARAPLRSDATEARVAPPKRRGVSPILTLLLVAGALACGVLFGPRIMKLRMPAIGFLPKQATSEPTPPAADTSPPAPAVTAAPPASAATAAPATSASATAAPASASASAAPPEATSAQPATSASAPAASASSATSNAIASSRAVPAASASAPKPVPAPAAASAP